MLFTLQDIGTKMNQIYQIHPAGDLTHILTSSHITPCHPVQALGVSRGESGLDGQLQRWDETVRSSRFGVFVATRLGRQISMSPKLHRTPAAK